jgi:transcriptional regulator
MHPNARFRWDDREAMAAFVVDVGFGTLFAATPDGPRVAHVPVVIDGGRLLFHIARGNALARHLDGATALFVINGPDGYISPGWYGLGPDEVPTWNYVAVEVEGRVCKLDRAGLIAQVDALTAGQEARHAPDAPWTRGKADPVRIERMFDAIIGFELDPQAWRGTIKLGQNKPAGARLSAADALDAAGRRAIAHLMRNAGD